MFFLERSLTFFDELKKKSTREQNQKQLHCWEKKRRKEEKKRKKKEEKMARNEEKAQSMLNRWLKMKDDKRKKPMEKRPFIASECNYLPDAEKWRQDVIKEIVRDVTQIQNESLGEYRIRELNDNINKRLREKTHWERRIAELGGRKYSEMSQKVIDDEGLEAPGSRGYKYFGAARNLPGVKDLFFQKPSENSKRNRYEMYSSVDADYYGFRDDDDGVLLKVEAAQTAELERQAKRRCLQSQRGKTMNDSDEDGGDEDAVFSSEEEEEVEFVAHVVLPSAQELEESLLQRKKEELLKKYLEDEEEEE